MDPRLLLAVGLVGRMIVGAVLMVAGLVKLRAGSAGLMQTIIGLVRLSPKAAGWLALGLPWAELALGSGLVLGWMNPFIWMSPFIVAASFGLLLGFSVIL